MVKKENTSKVANRPTNNGGASLLMKATSKKFGASKFALLAMNNGAKPPVRKIKVPLNSSNNLNNVKNLNNNHYNHPAGASAAANDADNRSRVSDITGSIGEEVLWNRPALVKEVVPVDIGDDFESDIMNMSNVENEGGVGEGREDEDDSGDSTLFSFTKAFTTPGPAFLNNRNNIGTAYKMTVQPDDRQQAPTVASSKMAMSKKTVSIAKGLELSAPSPMTLTRYQLQTGQERTAPVSQEYIELEEERAKERQIQLQKEKEAHAKKSVHDEFKREIEKDQGEGFEAQLDDFDPVTTNAVKKKSLVKQILGKIRPKKTKKQITKDEAEFMARKAMMASKHKQARELQYHRVDPPPAGISRAAQDAAAKTGAGNPRSGQPGTFPVREVQMNDERSGSVSDLDSSLRKVPVGEIKNHHDEETVSTLGTPQVNEKLDRLLSSDYHGFGGPESPRNRAGHGGHFGKNALIDQMDSGTISGTAAVEHQAAFCDVCIPGAGGRASGRNGGLGAAVQDETDFLLGQNPIFEQVKANPKYHGHDRQSHMSIGNALDDAIKNAGTRESRGKANANMTRSNMESRQIFMNHLSKEFESSMDKEADPLDLPELDDNDGIPVPPPHVSRSAPPPRLDNTNPFDDGKAVMKSLSPIVEGNEAFSPASSPKEIQNLESLPKEIHNLESLSISKLEKAISPDVIDLTKMASRTKSPVVEESTVGSPRRVVAPGNVVVGSVVNSPSQKGVNVQIGQQSTKSSFAKTTPTPKTRGGVKKEKEFFDINRSDSAASKLSVEVSKGYDGEGDVISARGMRTRENHAKSTTSDFADGLFDLLPEDEKKHVHRSTSPRKKKSGGTGNSIVPEGAEPPEYGVEVSIASPKTKEQANLGQGMMCGALPLYFMFDGKKEASASNQENDDAKANGLQEDERPQTRSPKKDTSRQNKARAPKTSHQARSEYSYDTRKEKGDVLLEKDDAYWDTLSTIASTKRDKESSDSEQYMYEYEYAEPGPIPNEITTLSPTSQQHSMNKSSTANKSETEVIELLETIMSEDNEIPETFEQQHNMNQQSARGQIESDTVSKNSKVTDLIAIFEASQSSTATGTISTKETGSGSDGVNNNQMPYGEGIRTVTDLSYRDVHEITDLSYFDERDDQVIEQHPEIQQRSAANFKSKKSNLKSPKSLGRKSPRPCPETFMSQPRGYKRNAPVKSEAKQSNRSVKWGFEEIFEAPVLSFPDADDTKATFSAIAGAAAAAAVGAAETMGFGGGATGEGPKSVYSTSTAGASTVMTDNEEQELLTRTLELSKSLLGDITPQDLSDPEEKELFETLLLFGIQKRNNEANEQPSISTRPTEEAFIETRETKETTEPDDEEKTPNNNLGQLLSELKLSFPFQRQASATTTEESQSSVQHRSRATVASGRSNNSPIVLDDVLEKKSQLRSTGASQGNKSRETPKVQTSRLEALREKRAQALLAFQRSPSSKRGESSTTSFSDNRRNSTGSALSSKRQDSDQNRTARSASASRASSLERSRALASEVRSNALASRRSRSTGRSNVDRLSTNDLSSSSTTSSHASIKARELRKQLDDALQASRDIKASQEELGKELTNFKKNYYTKNGEIQGFARQSIRDE